ncbi:MAG: hypothetical protein AAF678_09505 [Pseudomonadota bacterium]
MGRVNALKMYGAVLWSDPSSERALIWCEDHADLAFFASECCSTPRLEPGDLVSFTLTEQQSLRVAENVEVVATEEYPFLADGLQQASAAEQPMSEFASDCANHSNVVPFVLPGDHAATPPVAPMRASQLR